MREIAQFVAVLACSLFAGAAVYINLVEHSVLVNADTLYTAVAAGLAAIRKSEWAAEIAQGFNTAKVCVLETQATEHVVQLGKFHEWLERSGGRSPREVTEKNRIREILNG